MKQSLYRKYRPAQFREVVGQNPIKTTLSNAITQGSVAHAYLFAGPRGTGKTTTARLFAKAVNCENPQKKDDGGLEPCNNCEACREIVEGRSLDLVEVDAASYRTVEEIDYILQDVRSGAHRLANRIFILDEAHMLSRHAFNALLKTLEEPPPKTVIILVTTEPHKLPATVRSRSQRFDFRALSVRDTLERLRQLVRKEGLRIEEDALKAIAVASQGSIRDAESNLDKVLGVAEQGEVSGDQVRDLLGLVDENLVIKFLSLLGKDEKEEALQMVGKLVERGIDIEAFLKTGLSTLRKLLLVSSSGKNATVLQDQLTEDELNVIVKLAGNWQPQEVVRLIEIFKEALENQGNYPLPQMSLEVAVVKALS